MVALEEAGSGASEAITLDALRLVDAAILRGWAVEAAVACGALKLALAASGAFDGNNAIQVRHEQSTHTRLTCTLLATTLTMLSLQVAAMVVLAHCSMDEASVEYILSNQGVALVLNNMAQGNAANVAVSLYVLATLCTTPSGHAQAEAADAWPTLLAAVNTHLLSIEVSFPNLPPPLWCTSPDHLALPPQVIVAAGDAVALLATDARACEAVDNVSAATATLQAAADGATAAQQSGVAKAVAALQVLRVAVLVPRLAAVVVHHGAVHALSEALTAVSSAPEGTTLQEDALVLLSGCVQQLIEAARELDASLSVEAPPPPPPLESDGTPGDSVVVPLSDTMATRALVPLSSARGKRCLVDEIASPELVQALVASVAATPSSR